MSQSQTKPDVCSIASTESVDNATNSKTSEESQGTVVSEQQAETSTNADHPWNNDAFETLQVSIGGLIADGHSPLEVLWRILTILNSTGSSANILLRKQRGFFAMMVILDPGFVLEQRSDEDFQTKTLIELDSTPLIIVTRLNFPDLIVTLLKMGADVNAADATQTTSLHQAATLGSLECVNALLEDVKINVNCADKHGITPLYEAVHRGYTSIVELLLAKGADPLIPVSEAVICSLLNCALKRGNQDVIEALGTHLLSTNEESFYDFFWDAIEQDNAKAVSTLLSIGASVNSGVVGDYPLMRAAESGCVGSARVLIDNGIDIEAKRMDGQTALFEAGCHKEMMKELLANGAQADGVDHIGQTPLHIAAGQGTIECVELLLSRDVPIDKQTIATDKFVYYYKSTPLHEAVLGNSLEAVDALLAKGAKTECENSLGLTPLQLAFQSTSSSDMVRSLIVAGANVFVKFVDDMNLLHRGAFACAVDDDIIERLIARGVDKEARCTRLGATPLHYAVGTNNVNTVKVLLDHKVDLESRDRLGRTPLLIAVARVQLPHALVPKGNYEFLPGRHVFISVEVIELLLAKGARLDVKDGDQNTPLHIAAARLDVDVIEMLLLRGADPNALNGEFKTPYQVFIENSHLSFLDWEQTNRAHKAFCKRTKVSKRERKV